MTPAARPLALVVVAALAACGERPAPRTVATGEGAHRAGRVAIGADRRDPTAGNGWANAIPDLPGAGHPGGVLFDFRLP